MSLSESPFRCCLLGPLFSLGSALIFPSYWFLDRFLSVVVVTSVERSQGVAVRIVCLLGAPLFLLLFAISLPLAVMGLLLWVPLHQVRRPFCYQRSSSSRVYTGAKVHGPRTFTIISANLCLLPDGLARFSNLGHTQWRSDLIAQLLVAPQEPAKNKTGDADAASVCSAEDVLTVVESVAEEETGPSGDGGFPGQVAVTFPPDADFLCLQEVFDGRASRRLRHVLASSFPHVLYDVGPAGPYNCGFRFFNSGLFLASRHPPVAAKYYCYPNARGEDALAAKGLLCVKVLVGVSEEKQRIVGYINCTHLHAPEEDADIRCDQMTLLLQWISEFQSQNSEGEIVAFDVLCGDLNFDNCSPDDCLEQKHELFSVYTDPCRGRAGQERRGTVARPLRVSRSSCVIFGRVARC
ncbi:sphingomyelin phosphodiesterase 5-like isoform X2 [Spea bombifrons]|uniref:sphingomyelin phosphodiesterase 5-like isoform X2 n=1 Tax=Spea bombifrons TaxID=233779 RepID=UPI00234B91C6|nr:sphingomyelin phosphodiesterase 5-like isoform X2 [Spea bombifrons]